jgi:hypothetical protein
MMVGWRQAGLGGPQPQVFSESASSSLTAHTELDAAWMAPTETAAALVGALVCAVAGYGLSTATADEALARLSHANLFSQDVLYTDLLMKGLDGANAAGIVLLPLAALYLMKAQGQLLPEEDVEDWACIIDEFSSSAASLCGPASFDSTEDGLTCIADESGDSIRWVCV